MKLHNFKLTSLVTLFLTLLLTSGVLAQPQSKTPVKRSTPNQAASSANLTTSDVFNLRNFGAVSDGVTDDTNALIAALNAAKEANGGTIVFPAGVTLISRQVPQVDFNGHQGQLRLTGVGGRSAVMFGNTDDSQYKFSVGNLDQFIIENITFIGKDVPRSHPEFHAATLAVFYITYTEQMVIKDSTFYNLSVNLDSTASGVVSTYNTTLKIENSMFNGCAAPSSAVVNAINWTALEVRNTNFFDYGNYGGVFYSKSHAGARAWIRATDAVPHINSRPRSFVVVEDSSFDEGAANAILVENARGVSVKRVASNDSAFGAGVNVKNVKNVKVEQSWFGYTPVETPGIIADNVDLLELDTVEQAHGVKYIWLKGATRKAVIRYSDLNEGTNFQSGVRNDANAVVERVN